MRGEGCGGKGVGGYLISRELPAFTTRRVELGGRGTTAGGGERGTIFAPDARVGLLRPPGRIGGALRADHGDGAGRALGGWGTIFAPDGTRSSRALVRRLRIVALLCSPTLIILLIQ